ncbi:MAG: hypothetical protein IJW94_05355 [Oscillospiraceae bacterium]|nr:hypothetical protein [Oscillospiraceae bacterium]
MEKTYLIAGLTVKMDTYGRTLEQAKPYLYDVSGDCDIAIVSNWKVFRDEFPSWSDDMGEYIFSGFDFYKKLLGYDGMMVHSSAVVVDGTAYLFTADSGTGKSTHTNLWLKQFGDRAYILNDDKPAIRREKDGWFAYGTPWSGKHDLSRNIRVPLGGVAVLNRAEENAIAPFAGVEAIQQLLKQINRPKGMDCRVKVMELLDLLMKEVPIWKLDCNMEVEAAQVAYGAMSGKDA